MIPNAFQFHAATSVSDAVRLLNEFEDAKIIAGGHSLLPMMKLRFAEPAHLIDINGVPELKGLRIEGDFICIGAMTTETELVDSSLLQESCPLLIEVAKLIADPQIRNRGTIGGDVAHGDPGNDHPAIMMALDAEFVIQGKDGERCVPANGFFMGTYWTGLEEGELLSTIKIPLTNARSAFGFNKIKRKTGDFATAAACAVLRLNNGVVDHIHISLTNVAACAIRAEAAEQLLMGQAPSLELIQKAASAAMEVCDPAEDLSGDVEYKTAMAGEMTRRSLMDAVKRAGGVL